MRITPFVVLTCIFGSVQSQWVPEAYTIPDQMLALSPDGTKAIGIAGIYTQTSGSWTLSQSLSFQYKINNYPHLSSVLFLQNDGSVFAVSNYSNTLGSYINIYKSSSPGAWTLSSTLYATSLGYDISGFIVLEAVTADGNTLIVAFTLDLIVLQNNGTDFVFKQNLATTTSSFFDVSVSADGSTIATYESVGEVVIFSQKNDGSYELTDEHSGMLWGEMALSSNGQFMIASYVDGNTYLAQIHFFTRINGQYRFMSAVDIIVGTPLQSLRISFDASIVFIATSYPSNTIYILKQTTPTSWTQVQNLTDPDPPLPPLTYNFDTQSYCSSDGSTLFAVSSTSNSTDGTTNYYTYVFTAPAPTPSSTPTPSPSTSSSATPSSPATSSSSATATSSVTSSSSATATSSSNSGSSLSTSTFPEPATITISVLSTALTLISVALFAKWLSNYRMKSLLSAEDNSERSETLLRVN